MPSDYCRGGAPFLCLWIVLSGDVGIFAACAAAFAYVRRRPDDRWLVHVVLLAGLTYVLYFPFTAMALAAREWSAPGARDLLGRFLSYWWGGYGGFDSGLLIGVSVCTAAYCLARERGSDGRLSRAVVLRDVVVGLLLIVFGVLIGVLRHEGIVETVEQQIALAKAYNHKPWLDGAEHLRSQLWNVVLQSALPYVIVGSILAFPLRLASHRPRE